MNKIQEQIWQKIQEMNRKWTVENNASELKNYFHKNMVAITTTGQKRIEGGEKCVAGWKNFTKNATIHFWKELEPKIQLYGEDKFAIVTYYYEMSFDMGGHTMNVKGRDMFALINENDNWLVVADHYSSYPDL